jgi:hypothetical protein
MIFRRFRQGSDDNQFKETRTEGMIQLLVARARIGHEPYVLSICVATPTQACLDDSLVSVLAGSVQNRVAVRILSINWSPGI